MNILENRKKNIPWSCHLEISLFYQLWIEASCVYSVIEKCEYSNVIEMQLVGTIELNRNQFHFTILFNSHGSLLIY